MKNRNVVFPVIIFQIRGAYKEILKEIPTIFPVAAFQIQGAYSEGVCENLSIPFKFKVFTTLKPPPVWLTRLVATFQIQGVYKVFLTCLPFTNPVAAFQIQGVYNFART